MQEPTVRELIRNRLDGGTDEYRLAVALEGGGMRGVVSGAMLLALRDLGISSVVDTFFGTSSGAVNLAYFAAGGGWDALAIYYDELPRGIVRKQPWSPRRPPVDMGFVRHIWADRTPIDPERIRSSTIDARVVLANVDRVSPEVVEIRSRPECILDCLSAASWLPLLAGSPYLMNGTRYLDGGVLWPDPLYAALSADYTHILAVNTSAETQSDHSKRMRLALREVLNRWQHGLGDEYVASRRRWDNDRLRLPAGQESELGGARILRICPPLRSHKVTRLQRDPGTLLNGARVGYSAMMTAFGGPRESFFSIVSLERP